MQHVRKTGTRGIIYVEATGQACNLPRPQGLYNPQYFDISIDRDPTSASRDGKQKILVNKSFPLFRHLERQNMELIEMLLQHKADANTKDGSDNTPLLYATEKGMTEACLALIKSFFQILDNMR